MSARWSERNIPDLGGKTAVVTGSNSGLGLEAAKLLAAQGARVLMACRNVAKAERAADQVQAAAGGRGDVEIVPLDLASLASITSAADAVLAGESQLDLLLNNAGLMAIDKSTTEDGFETQFGVNHLGHFALTAQLAPLVLATPGSRIVTMSSFGHRLGRLDLDDLNFDRRGYNRWRTYFQSKLANMLFTAEKHRRLTVASSGTKALAAHPGATATDLGHEGGGFTNKVIKPAAPFMQSAASGVLPFVRAATDPDAESGEFYGPRWMFRGESHIETPSGPARNAADAQALWARSEELTGVAFDIPPT